MKTRKHYTTDKKCIVYTRPITLQKARKVKKEHIILDLFLEAQMFKARFARA
jgi:hypothetical protein